jgi:ribosomal protein S18 acetylase RimI-like enzyme
VLQVIVARDVADLGVPDFTLHDLRADWETPGLELEHDVRVAPGAGEIRGYAILLGDDAVVIVHPEAEGPLRQFEPDDAAAVHRLIEEAFTEIEGNTPQTLEEWRAKGMAKAGHDPALWLLAEDEQGVVGAALGERWESGTSYVGELAVARRARGRGLGRALLLGDFAAFRRAGLTHAELNVHGRNRGALALYESVGMRSTWEAERWEKALGRA